MIWFNWRVSLRESTEGKCVQIFALKSLLGIQLPGNLLCSIIHVGDMKNLNQSARVRFLHNTLESLPNQRPSNRNAIKLEALPAA